MLSLQLLRTVWAGEYPGPVFVNRTLALDWPLVVPLHAYSTLAFKISSQEISLSSSYTDVYLLFGQKCVRCLFQLV
jgi:hypothetical protein